VGQTKKQLKIRIHEHIFWTLIKKWLSLSLSVVSNYRLTIRLGMGSKLDNELFLIKRIILEIIHIKKQRAGLNNQINMELLLGPIAPTLS